MAGNSGSDSSHENPLPLNVVPLIDVIFCLLLFFMCSFHFKQLEGKMSAWLPTDVGVGRVATTRSTEELRVRLHFDPQTAKARRTFGRTDYESNDAIAEMLSARLTQRNAGFSDQKITLQCDSDVPWEDVLGLMDSLMQCDMSRIEFSLARNDFVIPDHNQGK